jgi:hypothetical protein
LGQRLGQFEIESREIDQDDGIDRCTFDLSQQRAVDCPQRAQAVDRFHCPDDRQVADVEEQFHPSLSHPAPTHADELQGGLLST